MGCASSSAADENSHSSAKSRSHSAKKGSAHGSVHKLPDFGVSEYYEVIMMLGEGGSGITYLCLDKVTNQRVAIKFMPRPLAKILVPMVVQEIVIQSQLGEGHLNLVRCDRALITPTHLGLVMEYASGGSLTRYVAGRATTTHERGGLFLTEDEARYFFRQFINAVAYLHRCHVAHRDLKMDNVVLCDGNLGSSSGGSAPPLVKLIDFGFAKQWGSMSGAAMMTRIGTPVYMAPQLINLNSQGVSYNATAADVWSCGVLLFVSLLGLFPYDHLGHPDPNSSGAHMEVWLQQSSGRWREVPHVQEVVGRISPECQDLLDKIFELDEHKRITINAMKKHPWVTKPLPAALQIGLEAQSAKQAQIEAEGGKLLGLKRVKERDEAIQHLVAASGKHHDPNDPPVRIIELLSKHYNAGKAPISAAPSQAALGRVSGASGGISRVSASGGFGRTSNPSKTVNVEVHQISLEVPQTSSDQSAESNGGLQHSQSPENQPPTPPSAEPPTADASPTTPFAEAEGAAAAPAGPSAATSEVQPDLAALQQLPPHLLQAHPGGVPVHGLPGMHDMIRQLSAIPEDFSLRRGVTYDYPTSPT